ncbi:MAG: His-Xaa-Ser system radical SAM maturase HxsC [Bacteroidaceae bacterium]|nr:His-Xaa-Ser system radical SAM maturase HxsC [Bacteroidaceae bacterium]
MKQINGIPINIESDILGRITLKGKSIFNRKDEILLKADATSVPSGYSAVITNSETINGGKPCVGNVQMLDEFNEGDVVLINKRGEIVFLYEIKSSHNAIFATERCNHRCIMCPQPPVTDEEDKTPFNLKLISLMDKNTQEVGITGGEPTLIGDKLFDLIRQIQKYQPKAGISLLTNGVKFADKEYAMKLAMCKHHDLQIDVPIFSDIADEHNRIVGAKTFYKTVQGLYNLALFHQRIGLRIVVHKQTYKRLPQLADYIYHNFPFVSQVAFLQMETTGNADTNLDELWIDPYDYNEELKQAVLLLANRGICSCIYNAQLCVLPHEIREFAVSSISDWKDTYLPECESCKLRQQCGGLFASNQKHHSAHINPNLEDITASACVE